MGGLPRGALFTGLCNPARAASVYACCIIGHGFHSSRPLPVNERYSGYSIVVIGSGNFRTRPNRRNRLCTENSFLTDNCCGGPRGAGTTFIRGPLGSTCPRAICGANSLIHLGRFNRVVCVAEGSFRVGRVNCHVRLNRVRATTTSVRGVRRYTYICYSGASEVVVCCYTGGASRTTILTCLNAGLPPCLVPGLYIGLGRVPRGRGNGVSEICLGSLTTRTTRGGWGVLGRRWG